MSESAPTVVLVHGAFADASSFARVIPRLLDAGLDVLAPAVPNRSLLGDAAYIASAVRQINGPVVLVGHSYGGAVITVAGIEDNVKALVYLSGYALEVGESLGQLQGGFPDSALISGLVYKTFPIEGAGSPGTDVSVDPAKFHEIFAADVDPDLTRVLAVGQRPLAAAAFEEKATAAAWKTKPAWASVSINDRTINPDVERYGYRRAGITPVEIESSHLVMLSHPQRVADLIQEAVAHMR
jgi:pimeloyl-ACP methyl ester carboxylesterase